MKSVNLMFSTALASLILLAPAAAPQADAAGIKIKPQIVKVKPKIAVAKPKVKVRVRAAKAKVRVKPKIKIRAAKLRIKPRVQKSRIVLTKKIKPKLTRTVRIRPAAKPRVTPQVATARISTRAPVIVPRAKPSAGKAPAASGLRNTRINTASLNHHRGVRDAMKGARGLDSMKDTFVLGTIRTGATAALGMKSPDLGTPAHRNNRDWLPPVDVGDPGGLFGGTGQGLGGGTFTGIGNSHSKDAPSNRWAVTPESVQGAAGGVAGQRTVRLPVHNVKDSSTDEVYAREHFPANSGTGVVMTVKNRADGTSTVITDVHYPDTGHPDDTPHRQSSVEYDANGEVTDTRPSHEVNELRNPDYVEGDPDCRDIGCIVRGGGKPKGLEYAKVSKGKNQVFTSPENAQPNGANSTAPVYSANDVLERYDDDNRRRGDGRTVIIERLQSD
ncbi:MAG: hypothetical protein AAFW74_03835 [Pseudomonadota bacterium]